MTAGSSPRADESLGCHHPAHFGRVGPNTRVTISPDAMKTYTMTVDGQQRMYKVHRAR